MFIPGYLLNFEVVFLFSFNFELGLNTISQFVIERHPSSASTSCGSKPKRLGRSTSLTPRKNGTFRLHSPSNSSPTTKIGIVESKNSSRKSTLSELFTRSSRRNRPKSGQNFLIRFCPRIIFFST